MLWKKNFREIFCGGTVAGGNWEPSAVGHRLSATKLRWLKSESVDSSKFQRPGFGDKTFSSPAIVFLFLDELETCFFVKMACGREFALCPKDDLFVSGLAGEADTLVDQPLADGHASGGGLDRQ